MAERTACPHCGLHMVHLPSCPLGEEDFPYTTEEVWTLKLNRYQRDNLLLLLNMCGYPASNPHVISEFQAAVNTGGWLGDITEMLARKDTKITIDQSDHPNTTAEIVRNILYAQLRPSKE